MAPRPRQFLPPPGSAPRQAGVLLLLYPKKDELYFVLTVRTASLDRHSGQVSLPGGGREEKDASFQETALREAREEIGIDPWDLEVLGQLSSLYIPPSHNTIHPIVAYTPRRPHFQPDPTEVAKLLEVPLTLLLDPSARREEDWTIRDRLVRVPFYAVGPHQVWGATAIVLAEFAAVLAGSN